MYVCILRYKGSQNRTPQGHSPGLSAFDVGNKRQLQKLLFVLSNIYNNNH